MRLGLFSAALPEQSSSQVLQTARDVGFASLEVAAWPAAFEGPTHLDITVDDQPEQLRAEADSAGIGLSALSCYANPLDHDDGEQVQAHLGRLVDVAGRIGVAVVGAFVGRNPARTVREDLEVTERFLAPLAEHAADIGCRLNYHPSHLVPLGIDPVQAIRDAGDRGLPNRARRAGLGRAGTGRRR